MVKRLCITFKDTCGPSSLHLRDGHNGSQWLHQTNDRKCRAVQLRRKHILVQRCFVLRHWDHIWGQERKRKPVTCGKYLQDRGSCQSNFWSSVLITNHYCVYTLLLTEPTTRSTPSTTLPSSNSTLDPWNLRMLGFTWIVPERMRLGSSSLTVGCWFNNLRFILVLVSYVITRRWTLQKLKKSSLTAQREESLSCGEHESGK